MFGDWDPAVLGAVDQHDGALHAVLCGAGIVVAGSGRDGVVARGADAVDQVLCQIRGESLCRCEIRRERHRSQSCPIRERAPRSCGHRRACRQQVGDDRATEPRVSAADAEGVGEEVDDRCGRASCQHESAHPCREGGRDFDPAQGAHLVPDDVDHPKSEQLGELVNGGGQIIHRPRGWQAICPAESGQVDGVMR